MAKSYYSTVFEQPADAVWRVIRDFNNYPVWVDGAGSSHIEDGKSGEAVGAIRNVLYKDMRRRQRLLALSDVEREQTYEFAGDTPLPVQNFQATIRVIRRRRSCLRRMVGELRLRAGAGRGARRLLPRRLRRLARLAQTASYPAGERRVMPPQVE